MHVLRRTQVQAVSAAAESQCVCGGAWAALVTAAFVANHIPVGELCHRVLKCLELGWYEENPVIVLAGARGGEGKSVFLKGLAAIFGPEFVFMVPHTGNVPMHGVEKAKIVFLDD